MSRIKTYKRRMRIAWAQFSMMTLISSSFFVFLPLSGLKNEFIILIFVVAFLIYIFTSWKMLVVLKYRTIPVFNYHSIVHSPEWLSIGDYIAISPIALNHQLKYLKKHNYLTLKISELVNNWDQIHSSDNFKKYVALTFDDGYADNWKYAYPLLKGYDMKATIFITSDFVPEQTEHLNSVLKKNGIKGYLSWIQMQTMIDSGYVEIQAHGATHTRVFSSDKCVDFHYPGYKNIWTFWNINPQLKKTWWMHDLSFHVKRGTPLYSQAPALCANEFIPDSTLVKVMQEYADGQEKKNPQFWKGQWRKDLLKVYSAHILKNNGNAGCYESDSEYRTRVIGELNSVKNAIKKNLGVNSTVLCWPENEFTERSLKVAQECGFVATVSNFFDGRNGKKDLKSRISRIFVGAHFFGIKSELLDFIGFWATLKCYEGYYLLYPILIVGTIFRKLMTKNNRGPFSSL